MNDANTLNAAHFGPDFKWGVSSAAFQTEGFCDHDGKGPSIWDTFSRKRGKIFAGHRADAACEFYRRYESDIDLVGELKIPNFRFSFAWSRILPNGSGAVNQKGIDYYNRVIDHCLARGVEPWITLYHWDLPQALEDGGGWTNRDIVSRFADYTALCAKHFGDRVRHWMVLNEPMVFTGAGYFLGIHAPGRKGVRNFLPAVHHAVLAMGEGGRTLRSALPAAQIGTTFSASHVEPWSANRRDVDAAVRADALLNRLFIEPVSGLGYPIADASVLTRIQNYMKDGDEQRMPFDFDFVGLQNYTREIVRHSYLTPYISARIVDAETRRVPVTDMKWEVYPDAIYHTIKRFSSYRAVKKIVITENGAAFPDIVVNGAVNDPKRTAFLRDYLAAVLRAKHEGCPVDGYFVWTLTDNFEWAEGYRPRFGLVYVDFDTQQRIVKESGRWYSRFINRACGNC